MYICIYDILAIFDQSWKKKERKKKKIEKYFKSSCLRELKKKYKQNSSNKRLIVAVIHWSKCNFAHFSNLADLSIIFVQLYNSFWIGIFMILANVGGNWSNPRKCYLGSLRIEYIAGEIPLHLSRSHLGSKYFLSNMSHFSWHYWLCSTRMCVYIFQQAIVVHHCWVKARLIKLCIAFTLQSCVSSAYFWTT